MSADRLVSQIKAGSPEAPATASALGDAAVGALIPLVNDEDSEVRLLALVCLNAVGGAQAATIALRKLNDEDAQVVGEALQLLEQHPPVGKAAELLDAYKTTDDGFVRERIALISGRLAPSIDPAPWVALWKQAPADSELELNLLAGVARMGNTEARAQLVRRVLDAHGSDAADWLKLAEYQEDPWIVPDLIPMLDRTETAVELAPDRPDTLPLRTCDLAAEAILKLTKATVDFPTDRTTPYTPEEIQKVRAIALRVGGPPR